MKRGAYPEPEENEWVYPVANGYKFRCCDCGLVHDMDFEALADGSGVRFRVRPNNRATAASRRERKKRATR